MKLRNLEMAAVLMSDPRRLRSRVARPNKGQGRKDRPRQSNRAIKAQGLVY